MLYDGRAFFVTEKYLLPRKEIMHYQSSSNAMKDGKTLSPDKSDILMAYQKVCFISFMVYFRLFLDCMCGYNAHSVPVF